MIRQIETIKTDKAPAAIGPYSQAKKIGGFLFTSGQLALNPLNGQLVGEDVESQTRQVLQNVKALLQEAGGDFDNVVKTTCFLANMDDFAVFNETYAEFFKKNLPARSAVEVARLPKDALVEVEVIAYID